MANTTAQALRSPLHGLAARWWSNQSHPVIPLVPPVPESVREWARVHRPMSWNRVPDRQHRVKGAITATHFTPTRPHASFVANMTHRMACGCHATAAKPHTLYHTLYHTPYHTLPPPPLLGQEASLPGGYHPLPRPALALVESATRFEGFNTYTMRELQLDGPNSF